jgi:hypothetical protein
MGHSNFCATIKSSLARTPFLHVWIPHDTGVVIAGSVDTVIENLAYYTDELHAGMMVSGCHVGEIPDELVIKQQELMAKQVMPHFRERATKSEPGPVQVSSSQ